MNDPLGERMAAYLWKGNLGIFRLKTSLAVSLRTVFAPALTARLEPRRWSMARSLRANLHDSLREDLRSNQP